MRGVWGLVHEENATFGISFPDVPGCVAAGCTLEEALEQGAEALSAHLAWMRADGDLLPVARDHAALLCDPEVAEISEDATWHVVVPRDRQAARVRVNIMIEPGLLRRTDAAAEGLGSTRSAFIESALHAALTGSSEASPPSPLRLGRSRSGAAR